MSSHAAEDNDVVDDFNWEEDAISELNIREPSNELDLTSYNHLMVHIMHINEELQTFYDTICIRPIPNTGFEGIMHEYIIQTLIKIMPLINFSFKHRPLTLREPQTPENLALFEVLKGNVSLQRVESQLPSNVPKAQLFAAQKRIMIQICFDIFREMFRLKDLRTCVQLPGPNWRRRNAMTTAWRMKLVLLDYTEDIFRTALADKPLDREPSDLDKGKRLVSIIGDIIGTVEDYMSTTDRDIALEHAKTMIAEHITPLNAPFAANLERYLADRVRSEQIITISDMKHLCQDVLAPFFEFCAERTQPPTSRLAIAFRRMSDTLYKCGHFMEFYPYAILFGKMAYLNEGEFRQYMPFMRG